MGSPVKLRALGQHNLIPSAVFRELSAGSRREMRLERRERGEEHPASGGGCPWSVWRGCPVPPGWGEMPTIVSGLHDPAWSVQRGGSAEGAPLTKPEGFIFESVREGQETLRDFSFSVNMRYYFCSPLIYHSLLPQKSCRLYRVPSSAPVSSSAALSRASCCRPAAAPRRGQALS